MTTAHEVVLRLVFFLASLGVFALYGLLMAHDPKMDNYVGVATAAELIIGIILLMIAVVPWGDPR